MAPRNGVSLVAALCLMALFVQVFVQQASAEYYPAGSPAEAPTPSPEGYPVPAPPTPPPAMTPPKKAPSPAPKATSPGPTAPGPTAPSSGASIIAVPSAVIVMSIAAVVLHF